MNLFVKTYKEYCKRQFGPLGFKNKDLTYWRIINDVVQSFYIWHDRPGNMCFLNFGVTPLATGEGAGGTFPATAFPQMNKYWWDFDKSSEKSVQICVNEIVEFLQQYVVPYFDRGFDSRTAFEENQKMYRTLYDRKVKNGYADKKHSEIYGGFAEYCMALNLRNWEFAKQYLKDMLANYREGLMSEEAKDIQYAKIMSDRIEQHSDWLAHIEQHDEEFVRQFIETNERKSLEALGLLKPERK